MFYEMHITFIIIIMITTVAISYVSEDKNATIYYSLTTKPKMIFLRKT